LAFSCGQNSSEKELTGDWREIESEFSTWHFYPDSLVLKFPSEWDKKTVWKANNSQIEFELPTFFWDSLGTPRDTINKILINYELSDNKDSIFGTLKNNYGEYKFSLLKTKNYIEYLKRKFGIEFKLPKDSTGKNLGRLSFSTIGGYDLHPIYGLKIFMRRSSKNKVIARTELSENLNNLEFDIKKFKDSIKPWDTPESGTNEMYLDRRFHLRVFADKSIPDSIIANNLKVIVNQKNSELYKQYPEYLRGSKRDTLPIRIYRILKSEEEIYPQRITGKEIKTVANTVYN
jgi:hypothetical protein